jgi:OOP family OmpA-OmpF porin
LLLLTVVTLPADAESIVKSITTWPLYFYPSAYYAISDPDKQAGGDYGFQFDAGYRIDQHWSAELLTEATTYKLDSSAATLKSRGVSALGVYRPFPEYKVQPVLMGGAGWMGTDTNGIHYDSPLLRAGVGLQWQIPRTHFGVRTDAMVRREFDSKASPDQSAFNDVVLSVGFTYQLGAVAQASTDDTSGTARDQGPPGRLDSTVVPAKGQSAEQIFHGTLSKGTPTAEDTDGDGVDNAHDKCPDTPPNAVIDADGCIIYMKK